MVEGRTILMNEEMWEQMEREAEDAFYIEVVIPAWQEEAEDSGLEEPF